MSKHTAEVIIIGGGVNGCAAAYYLAKAGMKNVIVLEGSPSIGHGGSSRNGGGVRQSGRDVRELPYAMYAVQNMWPTLSEELGVDVEYYQKGNLRLGKTDAHMEKLRNLAVNANSLGLDMKIGDVEYQGDKTKAIFYYIANDRVDFRKLIKILAETFHIRIEMKQIGARQEAGRIGGIGSCGRKLCCSTFITNFISVSTSAARYQDISLNPQKLAGQCGKLKCCLNYEVDAYIDAQKNFPSANVALNTGEGMLYHQKTDIFGGVMYYSFDKEGKGSLIKLPVKRIKEIITLNRKGIIPPKANNITEEEPENIKYTDGVGEESLNRFDEKKQKKRRSKNKNNNNRNNNNPTNRNKNNNKPGGNNTPSNNAKPVAKAGDKTSQAGPKPEQ